MSMKTRVVPPLHSNSFFTAFKQGLFAALLTLILFVLIVGFRADLNVTSQLELTPQFGYLINYVLIVAVGRFTHVFFGGGMRGGVLALLPTSTLFIGYRALLYYWQALDEGVYVFSAQANQLLIAFLVIAILFGVIFFLSGSRAIKPRIRVKITQIAPRMQQYGPAIVAVLLVLYPIFFILISDNIRQTQTPIDSYGVQILIYVMLAWGLNIVVGFAGLLDLGYVAFYAVGSYTVALLGNHFGFSFWLCLPLAGFFAALWGIILGFPVLRLRGDYLAIVTLAFGEIIRIVLQNWTEVTGGANGLNVPKATFFGIPFVAGADGFAAKFGLAFSAAHYKIFLYYVMVVLIILMAVVIVRLRRLPIGRAWEALREDEIACRALGINTVTTKLSAFAIGAMFGGFAGAFFAARQTRADYTSFFFMESVMILVIVVLGGMGSLSGIAVAATIIIGGMELLRQFPTSLSMIFGPDFNPLEYRMLWFGIAMVCVMIWKPRGFVSGRAPTAFLHEKKTISGHFTTEGRG